jgi:hypothetical protein
MSRWQCCMRAEAQGLGAAARPIARDSPHTPRERSESWRSLPGRGGRPVLSPRGDDRAARPTTTVVVVREYAPLDADDPNALPDRYLSRMSTPPSPERFRAAFAFAASLDCQRSRRGPAVTRCTAIVTRPRPTNSTSFDSRSPQCARLIIDRLQRTWLLVRVVGWRRVGRRPQSVGIH